MHSPFHYYIMRGMSEGDDGIVRDREVDRIKRKDGGDEESGRGEMDGGDEESGRGEMEAMKRVGEERWRR